jgi:pimeloyl-ACP methyl ester carboxylesterase
MTPERAASESSVNRVESVSWNASTCLTSDGRTLMFAEWGDPEGFPVFSFHGTPGSRLARHYDERVFVEAQAKVITYDRPGYGGSTRCPGRRVVDCVGDVVAIADMLGLERFGVFGTSGGGPHALAVAARLPERVTRATCLASPAPYGIPGWFDGMDPVNARFTEITLEGGQAQVTRLEREAEKLLKRIAADPANVLGDEVALSDRDRAELARPERYEVTRENFQEAFRTGVWGWVDDDRCLLRPWGFDPCEIHVPARIIYGTSDVLVPKRHGEWLAENLPGAEAIVEDDLGHIPRPGFLAESYAWLLQPV